MVFEALSRGPKSGVLNLSIGVGTVTMNTLASRRSSAFELKLKPSE